MTDAELKRLAVWARRHNPDRPEQVHRFHACCPWCMTGSDPEPWEGYDGGGSHSLGLSLIEEVQRLRTGSVSMSAGLPSPVPRDAYERGLLLRMHRISGARLLWRSEGNMVD